METGGPPITGMLLERQLECLGGIVWKEGVSKVIPKVLMQAKDVYSGGEMPVRRARILLKCMDFAYHMGPEAAAVLGCPQELGEEATKLLTRAVSAYTLLIRVSDMIFMTPVHEEFWPRRWVGRMLLAIPRIDTSLACTARTSSGGRSAALSGDTSC